MEQYNLGNALREKKDLDGAIAAFREAKRHEPKNAKAHSSLGRALLEYGEFAEAYQQMQRALAFFSARDPSRKLVSQRLKKCQQLLALEEKVPAIVKGDIKPGDAAECRLFADLCHYTKRYSAAVRFYAHPKLADDSQTQNRNLAARAAALAAAGKGKDPDDLEDKERTRLRQQALEWLRADLALWNKRMNKATQLLPVLAAARTSTVGVSPSGISPFASIGTLLAERASRLQTCTTVQKSLLLWKQHLDLASLRDKDALAKLPQADREACTKFWSDVDSLLARVQAEK
jgi:tetratricopeptide (TPR) repeat protein